MNKLIAKWEEECVDEIDAYADIIKGCIEDLKQTLDTKIKRIDELIEELRENAVTEYSEELFVISYLEKAKKILLED